MKQGQIYNAFGIIEILRKYNYAADEAYDLFKLRQKLLPVVQFQQEERNKLIDKYKPEKTENGTIEFKTREDADAYVQELNALCDMKADIEIEPIQMTLDKGIKMYPDDFLVLEGLIDFKKPEVPEIKVSMEPVNTEE